jgi:hypothetical protein
MVELEYVESVSHANVWITAFQTNRHCNKKHWRGSSAGMLNYEP